MKEKKTLKYKPGDYVLIKPEMEKDVLFILRVHQYFDFRIPGRILEKKPEPYDHMGIKIDYYVTHPHCINYKYIGVN